MTYNVPEYDEVIAKLDDGTTTNLNPIELFIYDWMPDDVQEGRWMREQLQAVVLFAMEKSKQR